MICPDCGNTDFEVMADITFTFPYKYYHRLTKELLTNDDFKLMGVNWSNADFICKNCGFVMRPQL